MSTLGIFRWKYPNETQGGYALIPTGYHDDIERYFHQLAKQLREFDVTINYDLPKRLNGYLRERLQKLQKIQIQLLYKYINQIERIFQILKTTRNSSGEQIVKKQMESTLKEIIDELFEKSENLKSTAVLISKLKQYGFGYYNVDASELNKTTDEHALERLLTKKYQNSRFLCSTEILNANNPSKFNELLRQLSKTKSARLIYADCTYCSFNLQDMKILPSTSNINKLPANQDIINILLLGETGVGKSTFVNAFVNYLTYDTLREAEANKPVVFIPVSFVLTTGDQFTEHLVQFGSMNNSKNENFNHSGQSVTQQCKTHRLDLTRMIGKRLCIIDTPGFGDTRGVDQDDLNMKHIFEYISQLSHLNAICFLLKPNSARLNIFFRTCLIQLFNLFGSNIRKNIIFCFTNARSTFYTPGDTAPLLRSMLESLPNNKIPFTKENTFCLDNEAFRYLVALQNGIRFNDEDRHDYESSWVTSVSESNRLLNYVRNDLRAYPLSKERQSDEHIRLIRPLLETMRNLLRNMILIKVGGSNKYIELHPKPMHQSAVFCTACKRDAFLLGQFWILPDDIHQFQDHCLTCQCPMDQHRPADYLLSYDITHHSSSYHLNEMNDTLAQLCSASAQLSYYLLNITRSTTEDLLHIGLKQMIEEEKEICKNHQESNHLNYQLLKELEILKQRYEEHMKQIYASRKTLNSQIIDQLIQSFDQIHMFREQMTVINSEPSKTTNFVKRKRENT